MPRLHTDSAFHIGAQHLRSGLPCQDYAVSGVNPDDAGHAYAIVSDGCSSGGRTDVGARIAALAGEQYVLYPRKFIDLLAVWQILGLTPHDMLATVVTAQVRSGDDIAIRVAGDGVVAVMRRDGALKMMRAEWAGNMPWYPAYGVSRVLFDGFIEAHAKHGDEAFTTETWVYDGPDVARVDCSNCSVTGFSFVNGFSMRVPTDDVAVVAAFSDGVCQVEGTTWQDVVRDLLSFKTTEGDFVKRRMNRFLRDHKPLDDISMAAILVEP